MRSGKSVDVLGKSAEIFRVTFLHFLAPIFTNNMKFFVAI